MSGSSSEINLKQTLRKLEYPLCAQEALKKIGELLCARVTNIKSMDLSLDLMAEFVFYEVDRRGNKRTQGLTPLIELQLLEILYEFLNSIPNEASRNTLFLNLFSPSTVNSRVGILSKLVSLAIGIPSPLILVSASTWMQQLGNSSPASCKLAEALVFDYAQLAPNPEERLTSLPNIAPEFTSNLLTAVAENYFVHKKEPMFPPQVLLKSTTDWVTENNSLCVAAQLRQPHLPQGAIPMEATTPIAGLLRWCVLAPIYDQNQDIYSKLYLALLNSISEIPQVQPPRAINVQHLTAIIHPLYYYYEDLKHKGQTSGIIHDSHFHLALDRLAQALQIALSVNAVYGHLDELFNALNNLHFNNLLSIVVNKYKQSKGGPMILG
ncbi:integrator complex subunit 15 [Euwallacea fornicatus]|uniref:integrator complex subunit 15 n=1 Tax=Euwallacea fornicatus TaxID=995702 RepID=UPI00338D3B22